MSETNRSVDCSFGKGREEIETMNKHVRKQRREAGGFTLVEVALSIAMGLVIIAAAMTAFNVTKRNAITATQQNEAAAMKALVETAVARGNFPAWTSDAEIQRGLFSLVETANKNPYTGTLRTWNDAGNAIGSYVACEVTGGTGGATPLSSPVTAPCPAGTTTPATSSNAMGGGFAFLHNASGTSSFIVTYADGTVVNFQGWAFIETDMSGNIVAAVGGGIGGGPTSS
jgi:type II secretory pathway pseudopilin PulG